MIYPIGFAKWLATTPLSKTIQIVDWIIPALQTIHIVALAAVFSSAMLVNLRLARLLDSREPLQTVADRFLPVIWPCLVILLATGTLLVIGEPVRSLGNATFYIKMTLVLSAIAVTLGVRRHLGLWERRRGAALAVALLSSALWSLVIVAGRWIAYTAQVG